MINILKEKSIPQIRFKGFTEAWEQCELGELADIISGGTPSTAISDYWDGDIDWYSPVEIGDKIYVDGSQNKITKLGLENSSAKILPVGTVLFTSRAGIGKVAILAKQGSTNQGFQSILPKQDRLDTYFIYSRAEELKRYSETVGAGSTFIEVSGKQLAKMPIMIPDMREQKIIGELFYQLDNLITLHQRKYDKLVNTKKALLDKMFPKNGEVVPQMRFKGFTEAWEQYKLGQFGYTQSGIGFPEAEQGGKKGIPFFKVSDMNSKGNEHVMTTSNNYVTESQISRKGWKPVSIIPAIMFAKVGAAIMLDRKRYVNEAFLLDNNTMAFSFNEKMEPIFGKVLFDTIYLPGLIQVGALPSFNSSDINEVEIRVPKYDEQVKVGQLFNQLDNLITLHQRKLDKLKNVKKSLLNKMFV